MSSVVVIGIGNPLRGDDGVGWTIVQLVRRRLPPSAVVVETGGDATLLLEFWRDAYAAVLVDAAQSGVIPGTISRFDLTGGGAVPTPVSSHSFGIAEAVALGRVLRQVPPRLIVFTIEGRAFSLGSHVSTPVARAVPTAARQVLAEARLHMGVGMATPAPRTPGRRRAPRTWL